MNYREIVPGKGLDQYIFGMTEIEIENIVKSWDKKWTDEEGDVCALVDHGSVELHFDHEEGFRLSGIEIEEGSEWLLHGKNLFPNTKQQILDMLEKELREAAFSEIEVSPWPLSYIFVPALWMFFFDDEAGNLREVSFGPFVENDQIIWPARDCQVPSSKSSYDRRSTTSK